MQPPNPFLQSAKDRLGLLAGNARAFLGKAGVKTRMALIRASKHPQVIDTRDTCSDLWSDLKELTHHPKVVTWREHMGQHLGDLRHESQHPLVAKIRAALPPQYLMMVAGTAVAVAMGLLATQALKHSQRIRTQEMTREAGMEFRQMRLQQRSQSIDTWRGEQEKLQRALKALEESRQSGAARVQFSNLWS